MKATAVGRLAIYGAGLGIFFAVAYALGTAFQR